MTVFSAIATATLNWTGVETSFSPGFQAQNPGDVSVVFTSTAVPPSATITLTYNTQYSVTLDSYDNVTVTPISLPAAPGTLTISRNSTPLQADFFQDGVPWSAAVIMGALDLDALRDQELRRDVNTAIAMTIAETARAEAAEAALAASIAAETVRAEAAEAAETTRAEAAEAAETTRAEAAEAAIAASAAAALQAEQARAETAEAGLAAWIGILAQSWLNQMLQLPAASTLPTSAPGGAGQYWNYRGVLCVTPGGSLPTALPAAAGAFWANSGVVSVTPGGVTPLAPALPAAAGLYWNNGGVICIS